MTDYMRSMLAKRRQGIHAGIPSFCTANSIVIEAVLEQAKRFEDAVLIEATANQVNQYGGYTGMTPYDFKEFVYDIAVKVDFPKEKIILGGDHLGPLTWAEEPEADAMAKAAELVQSFVRAGYKKIHLDTSMRLADDSRNKALPDRTIARRGVLLYEACETLYQQMRTDRPDEIRPVYIIGSEVPTPGGAGEKEENIAVTKAEAVRETITVYQEEFHKRGITDAFENIIAVVVQPGVEFGDSEIFRYDRRKAAALTDMLKQEKGIVFEGHSTDYQHPTALRQMVEDGIAILKVGPALTFALREGLFALSMMEKELIPEADRANFMEALEQVMLDNPNDWKKHYHGTAQELKAKRRCSFSDRCRYYISRADMADVINHLFNNMDKTQIPLNILHQYMPLQYQKVTQGRLPIRAKELVKDYVTGIAEDYNYAVKCNYMLP